VVKSPALRVAANRVLPESSQLKHWQECCKTDGRHQVKLTIVRSSSEQNGWQNHVIQSELDFRRRPSGVVCKPPHRRSDSYLGSQTTGAKGRACLVSEQTATTRKIPPLEIGTSVIAIYEQE